MKLSRTLTQITGGGSDGWDVFYRARAMIDAGKKITELTIGEHDIPTDPAILDAMHISARNGHTGYAMVPGTDALRDAVASQIETRSGITTTRDNVLITPGGQSALFAALKAACDPDHTALFIDPYYATYPGTIRSVGAIPQIVMTTPENGFQPRRDDLENAVRKAINPRSLLINSPNNPTGAVYTRQTLDSIAAVTTANDLWLISDEVYDSQVWHGSHISPRQLPDMADRTFVIGSMSKSHAMTGSRIGWVCGPPQAIEHLINLATHTTYGVAGFIQDAALFALQSGPETQAKVAEPFRRRRALTREALGTQTIVKAVPPDGAMYVMLDIRATGLSGEDFANHLLDAEQIAVMPGESFGKAAAGHIRIAMTIDDAAYLAALHRIIHFAHSLIV